MGLASALVIGTVFASDPTVPGVRAGQVVENPSWVSPPDVSLASELMPGFAATIGVSGDVSVSCPIAEDGHPFRCQVVSESVPGLGFGAAARLVAASGRLRTKRIDGEPVPSTVRFTVRFFAPDIQDLGRSWTGPEPTPERLRLARTIVETLPDAAMLSDDPMDGLDHDRRVVVGPWVDELIALSDERRIEIQTVRLARLLDEAELQGILKGRFPEPPTEEEWLDACPELTPEEKAGIATLRERYCSTYPCEPL